MHKLRKILRSGRPGAARRGRFAGPHWVLLVACLLLAGSLPAQVSGSAANTDPLHQFSSSLETLVERVSPSIVQVLVTGYGPLEESDHSETGLVIGKQRSLGSGVILDPGGYIVTNAHVVTGGQRIQVVVPARSTGTSIRSLLTARGRTLDARVIGVSREIDLAVLKIEARDLPALPIAPYDKVRQGELVFAFGSPEGLRNSVTMGVISDAARQPDPDNPMIYIQTDAPINPGNSGGPLVDVDGELVGINTFILSQSGGNEGLGFAIPCGVVSFAYPQLKKYGHVHRGEIGVSAQTITPMLAAGLGLSRDWGVVISDIDPEGPADKAGLKIQDIILTVDGRPADNLPLFGLNFYMRAPGDRAKVEVLRGSDRVTANVAVVERPHEADKLADQVTAEKNLVRKLGILGIEIDSTIAALLPDLREDSGVIVAARASLSGGSAVPLASGDVIHAVNGTTVKSLEGLRTALNLIKPDSAVVLQVERDGKLMFLAFQME